MSYIPPKEDGKGEGSSVVGAEYEYKDRHDRDAEKGVSPHMIKCI